MATPVLSVQKHTLTIDAPALTQPTDLTFTADTPPNVQMTSPLGELPSLSVGDEIVVKNHTTHNGIYDVVTVNTDLEDYLVESINGDTGGATAEAADIYENTPATAALTGSPTTANCVPFITTRLIAVETNPDTLAAYSTRAVFTGGDTLWVGTGGRNLEDRALVIEATVVEFNPAEVNVYSGLHEWTNNSEEEILSSPFGAAVDLTKSFLYFTFTGSSAGNRWDFHSIRGRITGTNELTFDTADQQGSFTKVAWYVVEAKNTAWAVDAVDVQIADLASSNTDTFTAVGDDAKTLVLGSHKGSELVVDGDSNADNTIDVTLTDSGGDTWDTVTATRSGTDGVIDWSGFVVELAGSESVYRGTLTTSAASPDPAGHTSIGGTVVTTDSMVHPAGSCGLLGNGGHTGIESDDVPDTFCAWTFFSTTQIDCEHKTTGGESGGSVSWEVIEWDVGGAPPGPTRRVMVR